MRKTFKYRAEANKQALENAETWLSLCRRLYNAALEQRITVWKRGHRSLSVYDQYYQIKELRAEFPEYQAMNCHILRDVLRRVDLAYKVFFRRLKAGEKAGYPRFKGKNRYDSFASDGGWKLDGRYLAIKNVGMFKLRLSRPIQGDIKVLTMRRTPTGKWFACFSCDNVTEHRLPASDKVVGLDVGLKAFVVDSDGGRVESPKYLRQAEAILRRRQRQLCRRVKGGKRRGKSRLLVAKIHEKVTDQRRDFLHKTANYYIANYDLIVIEDLKIKYLVKNPHVSKSILDSGWGTFFELLAYKAEGAGRQLVKVNSRNTSQKCSGCGEKVAKDRTVRIHACPYCGLVLDRDENAARNICAGGQPVQSLTYEVAQCVG